MQLERQLRPEAYCRRRGGYVDRRRTHTADASAKSGPGGENHPAHPLRTTVVRPSPSSWWDSTSSIRFSASGCREKRNAEAVRICRVRYQDAAERAPERLYGPLSGYPRAVSGATMLRGWMNE
jgi:hypothetical protein